MAIQLIAVDLDGTLYGKCAKPSLESIRAIDECASRGIRVCICTGRSFVQVGDAFAAGVALDDLCVLTNGASIVNRRTGKYVLERRIDPGVAEAMLLALAADCRLVCGRTLSVTGMYETHALKSLASPLMLQRWKTGEHPYVFMHDTLESFVKASRSDIQRIDYSVPYSDGQRVVKLLSSIVEVDCTTGDPRRLELVPKGIHKGDGLERLANYYGISQQNVMAIGDGINDDTMIRWAGLGVAMGNAVGSLKDLADAVTDTCEDEGLAKAIQAYVLEG